MKSASDSAGCLAAISFAKSAFVIPPLPRPEVCVSRSRMVMSWFAAHCGIALAGSGRRGDRHLGILELRNVLRDGICEPELAFFDEDQDRHGRDRLAGRGQAEQRVLGHRLFGVEVHQAVRFEVRHTAAARDDRDRAGYVLRFYMAHDHLVNALQSLGGEPDVFGLGSRQRSGSQRP